MDKTNVAYCSTPGVVSQQIDQQIVLYLFRPEQQCAVWNQRGIPVEVVCRIS
jgi:hypothetical protein